MSSFRNLVDTYRNMEHLTEGKARKEELEIDDTMLDEASKAGGPSVAETKQIFRTMDVIEDGGFALASEDLKDVAKDLIKISKSTAWMKHSPASKNIGKLGAQTLALAKQISEMEKTLRREMLRIDKILPIGSADLEF